MGNILKNTYQYFRYSLLKRHVYAITSPLRVLPECTVIGTGKGGTTALYYYLNQHPCIAKSAYDELGYYNDNYHLGISWYKSLFPTIFTKKRIEKEHGKFLTYDVTPQYLRDPANAKRMFNDFPKMKLIALLRNPIDRTYSSYIARKNWNEIPKVNGSQETFEQFVEREIELISQYQDSEMSEDYFKNLIPKSALAQGFYGQFLEKWFEIFDRKQFLILPSSELADHTSKTTNKIFRFLELPEYNIPDTSKQNTQSYEPMNNETREILISFFKKYNNKLYSLLDRNFDWDK